MNIVYPKIISENKRNILKAAKIFFVFLIIMTFLSKSIVNWSLVKVKVDSVSSGVLYRDIKGTGTVKSKGIIKNYCYLDLIVKSVEINKGDQVKKGDKLFVFNIEPLKEELSMKNMELEKCKNDYNIRLIEKKQLKERGIEDIEKRLSALEIKLKQQQEKYNISNELFLKGGESRENVEDKKAELLETQREYESTKRELNAKIEENVEEERKKDFEIKNIELDMERIRAEIDMLNKKINEGIVTANVDGIIKEINFFEGERVDISKPLYVIEDLQKGFQLISDVDIEDGKYLKVSDEVEITLANNIETKGIIREIAGIDEDTTKNRVVIDIQVSKENISGGIGEFTIKKDLGRYSYLFPINSIYKDMEDKYFVYILNEVDGSFGTKYYVKKVDIKIAASNEKYVGAYSSLVGDEKVVVYSEKSLSDGMQVFVSDNN